MAISRTARVVQSEHLASQTRLLHFKLSEDGPLGFKGGQYIIVNSGVPLPGGKVAKRAYSILSADEEQHSFVIAVRRIGEGPGSNYMHALQPGAEVPFSGPWGQYFAPEAQNLENIAIIATDTGISAALGLVQGIAFRPCLEHTTLLWLVDSEDYFLPASFVEKHLPPGLNRFSVQRIPPPGADGRLSRSRDAARQVVQAQRPGKAYLSGDGALLAPIRDDLLAAGADEASIKLETYFNHLSRKAAP